MNQSRRRARAARPAVLLRRVRPAGAAALLALLAACAQQPSHQGASTGVRTYGSYNRPASYDPPGPASDPWGPWIREASRRFDVPERWIRGVMRQESGGRVTATSHVGAMGLLQLMPGTYAEMQNRYGLGNDPYHPYDNLMAGTAYMREMYDLYGSPAFLAAYNAGPRRLEGYLWGGRGLPAETRNYVARIAPGIVDTHPNRRAAPEIYAAADIPIRIPAGPRQMDAGTMLALREQRNGAAPSYASQPETAPVLLASATTSRGAARSRGDGAVIAMDPIPDGSTYAAPAAAPAPEPAPVQLAAAAPPAGQVVSMDPIPDGSTYASSPAPASRGRGEVIAMDPIPNPPEPAPMPRSPAVAAVPSALAAATLPLPPRYAEAPRAAEPARATEAPRQYAALPSPPVPPSIAVASASAASSPRGQAQPEPRGYSLTAPRGFVLIPSANAGTLPSSLRAASANTGNGNWAVQVGAFASSNLARTAASQARETAGAGGPTVMPVSQGRNTLYRARVTGLSRSAAEAACGRLRSRAECVVLSPEAQS
ncbi:lytic transglycosylase domain-containing protein [Roseomonas sp. NAR14]|uniref:Lytic transglycosylase domain-containing protein n=1 Tax=Roseomonas acroporae TaxID=2937791 RepID=A0A9X2BTM1_9PROT|nr:lytic transglycosylase domain-containing protein [Roseomonas acroporae]MCK8784467.1 lytic transglycosylase domain-containing protein [Roseomonas acroporae]